HPAQLRVGCWGLWIANQVCGLVLMRTSAAGTVVRLHVRPNLGRAEQGAGRRRGGARGVWPPAGGEAPPRRPPGGTTMPWRHRRDDVADRQDADIDRGDQVTAGEETVETVRQRFDVASMLAVAAGVGLVVIGAVALVRAGVDGSWYEPVVRVVGI